MVVDHSVGRRPLSSSAYSASFVSDGRALQGRSPIAVSNSDNRRHSSCSNTLRRFPSLTPVTELFQARPRPRLRPASLRRKISHLFNNSGHQRRVVSDTTHHRNDSASRRNAAPPVALSPLRPSSSLVDDWSAIARDIERSSSAWCRPSSALDPGPDICPAPDPAFASPIPASASSSSSMPATRRAHRSALGRGKRAAGSGPSATVTSSQSRDPDQPLSAAIEVVFETDVVDIVGSPNTSVSYSLPGAVFLTFPALSHANRGQVRLLHDVTVVLEGKAEYWDDFGRFSPFRVFTTTLPLIPIGGPIIVPSRDPESAADPFVTVRLDFDFRIPGWLPPSIRMSGRGSCTGVGYGAVATAVSSWSSYAPTSTETSARPVLKPLSSPYCEFTIRRHQMPTAILPDAPIESRSFIHTEEEAFSYDINLGTAILPVEATFTVPEVIDIYGDTRALSVGIRIRIQPEAYHAYRLNRAVLHGDVTGADPAVAYLMELGMIVEERHRFSSTPFNQYRGYFPVPMEQPALSDRYSLLGPRFSPEGETPFCPLPNVRCRKDVLRPCLLSEEGHQRNFVFDDGGIGLSDRWRRINVVLLLPSRKGSDEYRPRPGIFTPFVHISHVLKTFCTLRTPDVIPESRPITFTTALKFATDPSTSPSSGTENPPPFLQLYDESGEPRLPDPLPLYSPAAEKEDLCNREAAIVMTPFYALSHEPSGSGGEDLPYCKPLDPERRVSLDAGLHGSALRVGAVTPPGNEEWPKQTVSRTDGSRAGSNGLGT